LEPNDGGILLESPRHPYDRRRVLNVDAGVYAQIDATWKAQLNIENIFSKGYGLGGGQQQRLAGSPADLSLQGHRQVVRGRRKPI